MSGEKDSGKYVENGVTISRGPLGDEEIVALDAAITRVQEELAGLRKPGVSIVDELIAERRLEAWKEELEALEWRPQRAS